MSVPCRMRGLTMNGMPDADGDVFMVTDYEGLHSPSVDLSSTGKHGDGARVDRFRIGEKSFTVHGVAASRPNQDFDVLRIRRKLYTAAYPEEPGYLYVDEPSPGRAVQTFVYLGGELQLAPPDHNVQKFSIPLVAPDPRLYSQTETLFQVNGGPANLAYAGAVSMYPRAVLTANRTNPYIQHSLYGRLTLSGTIPAGTEIDFAKRQVIHPSLGIVNLVTPGSRTWWKLDPGNNSISSNGAFDVYYRTAYR